MSERLMFTCDYIEGDNDWCNDEAVVRVLRNSKDFCKYHYEVWSRSHQTNNK